MDLVIFELAPETYSSSLLNHINTLHQISKDVRSNLKAMEMENGNSPGKLEIVRMGRVVLDKPG